MSVTNPKGVNGPNSKSSGRRNSGKLADKRLRKRAEAEARNAATPVERTRAYRRQMEKGA